MSSKKNRKDSAIKHESPPEGGKKILVRSDSDGTEWPKVEKAQSRKNNDFATFYRNGDRRWDMAKIERRDPNRKKKIIAWIIFVLLVILAASLGGFYFFVNQEDKFSGEKINIEVQTPLSVASGDEITLTLVVSNQEAVDIVDAVLTVQYPSDFTFTSSSPSTNNEANNAWNLGEIKQDKTSKVEISGKILGELQSEKNFTAILSYVPANFLSEFQKMEVFTVNIDDSVFELDLSAPTTLVSDFANKYTLTYKNNSKKAIERVQVVLSLPDDFTASDFNPSIDLGETVWDIGTLASGTQGEISWQGFISAEEGAMREIKATIGYIDNNGAYQVQTEESTIIFVVNPQLLLTLSINGETQDNTASLGETLKYIIKYANESQTEIKNMTVSVELQGEAFDWDSLVDINSGTIADQRITWDQTNVTDLTSIKPGEEGEIEFSIDLHDTMLAKDDEDINYFISSQALARSEEVVDLEGSTLEVEGDMITTNINSRMVLRAEGRYYNDEYLAVGSGPLPPQVGQETQYQIYWYLQNGANEVSQVVVTAKLPENIIWPDDTSVTAGNLNYNSDTRVVTWTINKMPPHVGQFIAELEARFAVAVTPQASEAGKLLLLLDKSQATAQDTFTNESINVEQDLITSDLSSDPLAVGKGIVVAKDSTNSNSNINSM